MMTRAEFEAAEKSRCQRCGTKTYELWLGRYPITAWDDEVLQRAKDELTQASPSSVGEEGLRQGALDHVEEELWRRQPYQFSSNQIQQKEP